MLTARARKTKKRVIGIKCISANLPTRPGSKDADCYYVTYSLEEFRLFDFQVNTHLKTELMIPRRLIPCASQSLAGSYKYL